MVLKLWDLHLLDFLIFLRLLKYLSKELNKNFSFLYLAIGIQYSDTTNEIQKKWIIKIRIININIKYE
jgi:hypothetical protein